MLAPSNPQYARMPEVRMLLVDALERLGRHSEAIATGARSVTQHPEFPGLWFAYGKALVNSAVEQLHLARDAFTRAGQTATGYRGLVAFDSEIGTWKATASLADIEKLLGNQHLAYTLYRGAFHHTEARSVVHGQLNWLRDQARKICDEPMHSSRS